MWRNNKLNKKDIIISLIIIALTILIIKIYKYQNNDTNTYGIIEFIKLIGMGILDALSSIIPGISGTALLMYFGYYNKIINTFATLSDVTKILQNILVLIPFIIGFILGTVLISKIINRLIKQYPNRINTIVVAFMIYTLTTLSINSIKTRPNTYEIIIGIVMLIMSLTFSIKIGNKS